MRRFYFKAKIPLIIIFLLAIVIYVFEQTTHPILTTFQEKETLIFHWIALHPFLSALAIGCIYIFCICLFIPASSLLSLLVGMTYPIPYALIICVLSETLGACLFFIIVRLAVTPTTLHKKKFNLEATEKNFKKNSASYLLCLRFSHITPSWLINILAAVFKTSFWTFAWTCFLGTIPITYLIIETGKTLKTTNDLYHSFNWSALLNTDTKLLFLGFALLALAPIFIKKIIKH